MASDKIIGIILKAKDQASKQLKEIDKNASALSVGMKGLGTAAGVAGLAISALGGALIAGAHKHNEYVQATANLRDMLQLTTEEASFLMAAMARYGITEDTMVAVFRTMNRQGLEPTIDNLKNLLYTYEHIEDATKKMQYAQTMFGEQGIKQLIPWWEQLDTAQKNALGTQEDGVLVTDDMIERSRDYKEAVFDLESSWMNLSGTLGEVFFPVLVEVMDGVTSFITDINDTDFTPFVSEWEKLMNSIASDWQGLEDWILKTPLASKIFTWMHGGDSLEYFQEGGDPFFKPGSAPDYFFDKDGNPITAQQAQHNLMFPEYGPPAPTKPSYTPIPLPSKTTYYRKQENKELAKAIAEELGEVFANENIKDAQMLDDIRRMLRGLPMSIRDATARTEI